MSSAREPVQAATSGPFEGWHPTVIMLELPASSCYHAVGRLVVGGAASRLAFHVEQVEDLQLAVEALLSRSRAREALTVELTESEVGLRARLGPFVPAPSERERVKRMLCTLVQDADVQDSSDGEWIILSAARSRPPALGSS